MLNLPKTNYEPVMFAGGLDQISPTLSLKPGVCSSALNFECATTGGYTRISGYERLDGRPAPSSAQVLILSVTGSTSPVLGSTITGATSSATGILVASTATSFILTKITGTFNGTELLHVGGSTVATQTGFGASITQKMLAQYKAAAAASYRADIQAVPGSGAVLGAFEFNDVIYAFRNNVGGTAAILHKSTASGWSVVPLGYEIKFSATSIAPAVGATVTQGTATAVVRRVLLQSGAYTGGTAAGTLVVDTVVNAFSAGAFTAGITGTCAGAQTLISLAPSGKYQFEQANFYGSASSVRIYGCDGVNRAFEFDGTTYVPISTGTPTDTPKFIAVHKKQLFLAFGASAIHSAPGLPYDYTAISLSSEIATGDTITGFLVQPGEQSTAAMAIYQRTNTLMLYGTGTSSWNLVPFNTGTGAVPYSCQNMSQSYVLDDRGVMALATSLNYGNFEQATLTAAIRPFIVEHRAKTNCAVLCREKSQYRLYFSDGMGLHLTIVNGKFLGAMPIYYPAVMNNAWSSTLSTGDETILGSGADGYVYRLDKGTSFDGKNLFASITTNWDSIKSPRIIKRYRKLSLEVTGSSYAEIEFSYSLGYGDTREYAQPAALNYDALLTQSRWDSGMSWDIFFWDTSGVLPIECEMEDEAENVSLTFSSASDYAESFTLNSAIIHYTPRRGLR